MASVQQNKKHVADTVYGTRFSALPYKGDDPAIWEHLVRILNTRIDGANRHVDDQSNLMAQIATSNKHISMIRTRYVEAAKNGQRSDKHRKDLSNLIEITADCLLWKYKQIAYADIGSVNKKNLLKTISSSLQLPIFKQHIAKGWEKHFQQQIKKTQKEQRHINEAKHNSKLTSDQDDAGAPKLKTVKKGGRRVSNRREVNPKVTGHKRKAREAIEAAKAREAAQQNGTQPDVIWGKGKPLKRLR